MKNIIYNRNGITRLLSLTILFAATLTNSVAQVSFGKRFSFSNGLIQPKGICTGYNNDFIMCTGEGGSAPNGTVLTRLDTSGGVITSNFYVDSYDFNLTSIKKTNDFGYIGSGTYSLQPGTFLTDLVLTNMDSTGNVNWAKSYHASGYDNCINRDAQPTADGGFISCGGLATLIGGGFGIYDAMIMKTDSVGNILWWRIFDQTNWDDFYTVKELSNGDIIAAGFTWDNGLLIKFSANGSIIWQKEYAGNGTMHFTDMALLNNNTFLLTGFCGGGAGTGYLLSLLTDSSGIPLNSTAFGYIDSTIGVLAGEEGVSCSVNSKNEFLFGGYISYSGSGTSSFLIKTDSTLNMKYAKAIPNQQRILYAEEDVNDHVYAFSLDNNLWIKYYKGATDLIFNCNEADIEPDIITPAVNLSSMIPNQQSTNFITTLRSPAKSIYNPAGNFICLTTSLDGVEKPVTELNVYPNPVAQTLYLNTSALLKKLNIYDVNGKLVNYFTGNDNQKQFELNINNLSSGIYFLEGISQTTILRTKFSVVKE